jgi:c-di-GMP-related signal transduction protein
VTALLGWPMEDVLYGYRQARIQPGHQAINTLISSIDSDASMAEIEHHLSQEPLLAYRLLRYLNSAGLGLTREIDSLRQGLMVLGLSRTKTWLQDLLSNASHDPNLRPVRTAMVLRASFMAELLDAGESDALQRELYLCGLLSQIDLLLGESMAVALRTVPLPGRIKDAIVTQTGPYWPFLDVAMSLETPHPQATLARCAQHSFDLEEVNLALLHTLAELPKV